MAGADEGVIREVWIDARPDVVFPYLLDPALMVTWLGQAVEIDPRPGGLLRIDMNGRDVIRGKIVEVDPPRRVVFTWGWDREDTSLPPGSSTVEISLEARSGGTLVRLAHYGLPGDVRKPHAMGWVHYLARLAIAAVGDDPGPDPLATQDIVHGAPGTSPEDVL